MLIKADNEELTMFTKTMDQDASDLEEEINKMLKTVENLGNIWQGKDASVFINNVTNYLEKMKVMPKGITTLSKVTERINREYKERDEAFAGQLREVRNRYGK